MTRKAGENFLTYKQLHDLTGIPLGTLYCLVHKRILPHVRLGPRTVRFKTLDVNHWLETGYRQAHSNRRAEKSANKSHVKQKRRRKRPVRNKAKAF